MFLLLASFFIHDMEIAFENIEITYFKSINIECPLGVYTDYCLNVDTFQEYLSGMIFALCSPIHHMLVVMKISRLHCTVYKRVLTALYRLCGSALALGIQVATLLKLFDYFKSIAFLYHCIESVSQNLVRSIQIKKVREKNP